MAPSNQGNHQMQSFSSVFRKRLVEQFAAHHKCDAQVAHDYLEAEEWNYRDASISFQGDKKNGYI
jgi:hypothetical protein